MTTTLRGSKKYLDFKKKLMCELVHKKAFQYFQETLFNQGTTSSLIAVFQSNLNKLSRYNIYNTTFTIGLYKMSHFRVKEIR